MTCLHRLEVQNFRNLREVQADFASGVTIFYGDNGSGKTSLLEAIYYLGLARSFRTRLTSRIINHHADNFSLFGQVCNANNQYPIGLQRYQDGSCKIHVAGQTTASPVVLAKLLPLQLLDVNVHALLAGQTKLRRQFLDWGLFHVEPLFLPAWQRAERALKQRNAALRTRVIKQEVQIWDEELTLAANLLHEYRHHYIIRYLPFFNKLLQQLLPDYAIELQYEPGWPQDEKLADVLQRSLTHDYQLGYTRYGPQRADLQLRIDKLPAKDILSQGQQKLVAYAMRIAQGQLLQQLAKPCIYLIDDLPSELDASKREKVVHLLLELQTQVFITGISRADFVPNRLLNSAQWFHVERGNLQPT